MQQLKFSKLSLLSQREHRGLQLELTAPQTVLVAGNGFGKSAILKSLYEALGAQPHKIDRTWIDANVISFLEFTLQQRAYSALKFGGMYTIYDSEKNVLVSTSHVTSELAPPLSNLLDFRLVLTDKRDHTRIPPPSYAFAPFYVDQDRSWQKPWDSFRDLGMFPNTARSLSDYHSGLKPNAYYDAKAERDRIKNELASLDAERTTAHQALTKIRDTIPAVPLALDMQAFTSETEKLVTESQSLHLAQAQYRSELSSLNEEHQLWSEQVTLVEAALKEIDETFTGSLEHPTDVECPMCGQHYHNHIADQFELLADKGDLLLAAQTGRSKLREMSDKIQNHREKLETVLAGIGRVQQILAARREDISLHDVIAAEGRNQAQRYLQARLADLDSEYGSKQRLMDSSEAQMRETESRQRMREIRSSFSNRLTRFAQMLDVRLPDPKQLTVQGLNIGRGSEGPRALAAYYYAFLGTTKEYGSSTFCPIVIDAPNQQGQDAGHLQQILAFLLSEAPAGSQVIIASESEPASGQASIVNVTSKKNQVLREDAYEATLEYIRPFLMQSLL